jgi:hypothetical protein
MASVPGDMAAHGGAMAAHGDSHWGRNTNENKTYNNPKKNFACGRLIGWGVFHSYLLHQRNSLTKNRTFAQIFFCLRQADWLGCFALIFATSKKMPKKNFLRSYIGSGVFHLCFCYIKKTPRNFFSCGAHLVWAFSILFLLHQQIGPNIFFLRS